MNKLLLNLRFLLLPNLLKVLTTGVHTRHLKPYELLTPSSCLLVVALTDVLILSFMLVLIFSASYCYFNCPFSIIAPVCPFITTSIF